MGRSYWFECSRCGYRATVSGCGDRGLDFFVQTVVCCDCKQLYDAVTRLRIADDSRFGLPKAGALRPKLINPFRRLKTPPTFQSALNRLPHLGVRCFKWLLFKPQCPISALHRAQPWNHPGKCPRCGLHLEKSALPYRIWD